MKKTATSIFSLVFWVLVLLPENMALANDKGVDQLTAYEIAEVFSVEDNVKRLNLLVELYEKSKTYDKFLLLPNMCKSAIMINDVRIADKYSNELLLLADKYKDSWNYGNAIHDANIVLGLVELDRNDTDKAKYYLLKAGKTPGSPQIT